MGLSERESGRASEIDPSGFWRFLFWTSFVLGSLALVFLWLSAKVPQPRHGADYRLDYVACALVVSLMLTSISMARWLWGIKVGIRDLNEPGGIRAILLIAWAQILFVLLRAFSLLVSPR